MRKALLANLLFLLAPALLSAQDTFSIVAIDSATGEVGSAGASCIVIHPNGVRIISDVHPGVGAIHTQAYYLGGNQIHGKTYMNLGYTSQQVIDSLIANDVQSNPDIRQYGVIELANNGTSAAWTGIDCDDYKSHLTGKTYSIQGNTLLGQFILDSMESRFLNTEGNLACKLMATLQGAKVIGADNRCIDSGTSSLGAFIRVAKPSDTLGTLSLDLNVVSAPSGMDPIDSLQTLFDASGACQNVGVNKIFSSQKIQITPNPASDFTMISSTLSMTRIQFFSLTGTELLSENINHQRKHEISIEGIPRGILFAIITLENGVIESKLLVIQ